ncbi:hypothetical protein [Hyalangium versicolor]|uniref:hypothetical protein n=1 Tax=Hyalangium versicolor TaxID=2861190 RepID=UPI001CCEA631|nr:hypothetical protein [Hyalangium versicolor]
MPTPTRRSWPAPGRLAALLFALYLLPLACREDDPPQTPPPPTTEDPSAVSGQRIIHRRLESKDVTSVDSTGVRSTLSVLIPSGTAFETRPLVSTSIDTFKFENVPEGPYYLKQGSDTYVITSHRQLNLDEYLLGREDVITVPTTPRFTLTVDGLAPMDAYQEFEVEAPNAGAAGVFELEPAPQPGATSLTAQGAMYQSAFGRQELIDSTKGDQLYLLQRLRRSSGDFNYFSVTRALTLTQVTFRADEQATSVEGTFTALPPQQLTVDWRRSSFEAHRAAVHPLAVPLTETSVQHSLFVTPAVGGLSEGVVGYTRKLLIGNIPAASQDVNLTLEYGNPYPSTWGMVATVVHLYQVPVRITPQGPRGTVGVSLEDQEGLGVFTSRPVQARLSPPTQFRVDGADAQTDRTIASLTPVFTWEPPTLGTADVYELRIFRLYATESAPDVARSETVATFLTAQREVRVPPGVLEAKQAYVVRLAALRTPGVDLTRQPFRKDSLVDTSRAEALTSVLTTP